MKMVKALIDWSKRKINSFLKGKGAKESSIEIAGLDNDSIDEFHKEQINRIAEDHMSRIASIVPVQLFSINLKSTKKGGKTFYEYYAHVSTDSGTFAAKDRAHDLISLSNSVLGKIERQVTKKVGKARTLEQDSRRRAKR
jgi:ribosome-associated translation inhibitor RaiA